MTNEIKLEVGKQYKTRGGWRCVVVRKHTDGGADVWHCTTEETRFHGKNGNVNKGAEFDIISEWKEPRKGVAWLSVYEGGLVMALTENDIDRGVDTDCGAVISKTRVEWEEDQ